MMDERNQNALGAESQQPSKTPKNEWLVRLLVVVAAILLYIPNAGSFGLWDCWETHYGEVARHMFETSDFLSPWWGYKEQIGDEPRAGAPFFSKPILTFWVEALMMKVIGFGEWAVRLPMEIMGILTIFFAYLVFARLFSRAIGLFAAGLLMTAPLFYFLARQAMVDMPFVSMMTIGLLLFINGYFVPLQKVSNRKFLFYFLLITTFFLVTTVPQFVMLALDLEPESAYENLPALQRAWMLFQKNGVYHAIIYSIGALIFLLLAIVPIYKRYRSGVLDDEFKSEWMKKFSLWSFYLFIGLATHGKGLLGFMLPGAIIFFYLLINNEWKALRRLELLRGSLLFVLVSFPWYMGMFAKHGHGFYMRFFVHDHFNRLGAGVHQIDTGTFEHYIKWLGYGTFPWVAFVPLVLFGILRSRLFSKDNLKKVHLFLLIWLIFSYALFTLAATKFHHYIFPALPPLMFLVALYLKEFLEDKTPVARVAVILALALFIGVGLNIHGDYQTFRNMFTYKYDRPLPKHLPIVEEDVVAEGSTKRWAESTFYEFTNPFIKALLNMTPLEYSNFTTGIIIAGVVTILMMFLLKTRLLGFIGLFGVSVVLAFWCLNYYMPSLSPHWSQKYLFEDYYKRCTPVPNPPEVDEAYNPIVKKLGLDFIYDYFGSTSKRVCKEDIVAWLITWRGETYYTYNEIKPLMKTMQLGPYLEHFNRGQPFFALTQGRRTTGLKSQLDRETARLKKTIDDFKAIKSWDVVIVHEENEYFSLVKAVPRLDTGLETKEEKPEKEQEIEPSPRLDSPPLAM